MLIFIALQTIISDCADMFISLAQNTSVTGQAFTVGEYFRKPFKHDDGDADMEALLDSGLNVGNM